MLGIAGCRPTFDLKDAGLVSDADAAFIVVVAVKGVAFLLAHRPALTEGPRPVRQRFRDPNYNLSEL